MAHGEDGGQGVLQLQRAVEGDIGELGARGVEQGTAGRALPALAQLGPAGPGLVDAGIGSHRHLFGPSEVDAGPGQTPIAGRGQRTPRLVAVHVGGGEPAIVDRVPGERPGVEQARHRVIGPARLGR
jgi:hypothetical protein